MGYGESRLLNRCSNGVNCSEFEHEFNRRSVSRIVANDLEKVRVQSDLNRSVVINDPPEKESGKVKDVVSTVNSENNDESQSIDLKDVKETSTTENFPKTEELEDNGQSESIAKNDLVEEQSFDNYDFSNSNTKVIYPFKLVHKGNDKTLV